MVAFRALFHFLKGFYKQVDIVGVDNVVIQDNRIDHGVISLNHASSTKTIKDVLFNDSDAVCAKPLPEFHQAGRMQKRLQPFDRDLTET